MSTTMTAITVHNLSKRYKLYSSPGSKIVEAITGHGRHILHQALDGIDFSVPRGQTVGIVGRNGSGKSTLLRILAGIIDPTAGSFEIQGSVASLLDLGGGFVPGLKGTDNIMLNGRLLGLSKKEVIERTSSILDFAELGEFANQPVRTYSAGMLLRLGFAIAQSLNPNVLLIDEVFAVGDAAFQRKCLARIEDFRARGATVLLVTHSLADLGGMAHRVIHIDRGHIVREGPTEEIIQAYLNDVRTSATEAGAALWRSPSPHRRTTGEIVIEHVDMLGADGMPITSLKTGDPVRIRIRFKVTAPVESPMLRLQVFRADGLFVHGTNTYRHGLNLGKIDKDGSIEVSYERLSLLEGHYWANVGIYPDEFGKAMAEHAYDLLEPALNFEVTSARLDGAGVTAMPHKWERVE